jgi:hypothetical protein
MINIKKENIPIRKGKNFEEGEEFSTGLTIIYYF